MSKMRTWCLWAVAATQLVNIGSVVESIKSGKNKTGITKENNRRVETRYKNW
jgi:hypothetical protein